MPIDPNIALSFKPSVALEDPMQQYGRMQQIQANAMEMKKASMANALAARKMQGESAVANALKNFYAPQVGADGRAFRETGLSAVDLFDVPFGPQRETVSGRSGLRPAF